tara:strand:- start:18052 stop:18624 length:573 start_codon:yes stop_codon:yes gene_type:complete
MPAKSTKSSSKTPTKSVAKAAAPPAPVVAEENAVVEASSSDVVLDSMTNFGAKLQGMYSQMNSLKAEYRALERKMQRELKAASKITAKKAKRKGARAPSGFVKPTKISDELATFLSKPHGSEMARTDVTREINAYIRANNLQDKENGRKINPDSKLSKLLKIGKSDELTYFNLQRYMSHHFAKASKPASA